MNKTVIYYLLTNITWGIYDRLIAELKNLIPNASPKTVLTDFKSAAIGAFHSLIDI